MQQPNCSFCQLGRLGQRRKRIKSKGFPQLPLQNVVWGSTQTDQFSELSVSILAVYFSSFSILLHAPHQYSSKCWLWAGQRAHHARTSPRPQNKAISHILVGSPAFLITTSCPRCKPPIPGSRACLAGPSCSQDCCRNWKPRVKLCRRMPVKKWAELLQTFLFHSYSNMSSRTCLLSNVTLPRLCGTTLWFPCVCFRFCSTAAL